MKILKKWFSLISLFLLFGNAQEVFCEAIVSYSDEKNVYVAIYDSLRNRRLEKRCKISFEFEVAAVFNQPTYDEDGLFWIDLYVVFRGPGGAPVIAHFGLDPDDCFVEEYEVNSRKLSQFFNFQTFDVTPSSSGNALQETQTSSYAIFGPGPATPNESNDYFRYSVDDTGAITTQKKPIFNNPAGTSILGGSISRDGRIAVQMSAKSATSWQFSTRLVSKGNPIGQPTSWSIPAYNGYSPDISGPVEISDTASGSMSKLVRFLVYRGFRGVGSANQQSQILLQMIDDSTGSPIGTPKQLTTFAKAPFGAFEAFQAIAIAPDGHFVVFTSYDGACNGQIIKLIEVSSAGTRIGAPKILAPCSTLTASGARGMDISVGQ